jgi:hypothetical protein
MSIRVSSSATFTFSGSFMRELTPNTAISQRPQTKFDFGVPIAARSMEPSEMRAFAAGRALIEQ